MSADTFLQLAEEGGYLDAAVVGKLRNKLAGASAPVSVEQLVELLVKRKLLTMEQGLALQKATGAADLGTARQDEFSLQPIPAPDDTQRPLDLMPEEAEDVTFLQAEAAPAMPAPAAEVHLPTPATEIDMEPLAPLPGAGTDVDLGDFGDEDFGMGTDLSEPFLTRLWKSLFARWHKRQGWDSRLMLIGGGTLLFLLAAGALLYFFLKSGNADEYYQLAEDDYKSQLYGQAIQKFDTYLKRFPRHSKTSMARVRIGLSHMRMSAESRDWQNALETTRTQLQAIENEESFEKARPELATILPDILAGFVDNADAAETSVEKRALLSQAEEAKELVNNPDYLPTSQRDRIRARFEDIEQKQSKVVRDIKRREAITGTINGIQDAIDGGDSARAYNLRDKLLSEYPGAAKDPGLRSVVISIAAAEARSVHVTNLEVKAKIVDRPAPQFPNVFLTARNPGTAGDLANDIVYVQARGGAYALQGETGSVLWRRWLGFESDRQPIALPKNTAPGALYLDLRNGDLMRLAGTDGKLVWRAEVGQPAGDPVLAGEHILQASVDKVLRMIDASDGRTIKAARFPQSLSAAPCIDSQENVVFQVGGHSTLYVLDLETLECLQTVFVGHHQDMVQVSPAASEDFVFLVENGASDYCFLHTFARTGNGRLEKYGQPLRLVGAVVDTPLVFGNTLLVTTDRGGVNVFEVDAQNPDEPIRNMAQVHSRTERTSNHYTLLSNGRIFVAGKGLTEYRVQQTRGALERIWTDQLGDAHLAAPVRIGETLVTKRYSPAADAVIIEASRIPTSGVKNEPPKTLWKTIVGGAPAGPAIVGADRKRIEVASRGGSFWSVDGKALKQGRVESVFSEILPRTGPPIALATGAKVYPSLAGRAIWRLVDPTGKKELVSLRVAHRTAHTPPVAFADGLLWCTTDGQVHLADPVTGKSLATPFQLSAGAREIRWRPAVLADNRTTIVTTMDGTLHRLQFAEANRGRFKSVGNRSLSGTVVRGPLVLGASLFMVVRKGTVDELVVLAVDNLEDRQRYSLPAPAASEPILVGSGAGRRVLCATSAGELLALQPDGSRQWEIQLGEQRLSGTPLEFENMWICTSRSGELFRIRPQNGETSPWNGTTETLDVGQPLGAGALLFNRRMILLGRDGTLFVVPLPPPPEN